MTDQGVEWDKVGNSRQGIRKTARRSPTAQPRLILDPARPETLELREKEGSKRKACDEGDPFIRLNSA